jgi:hypothetical protein
MKYENVPKCFITEYVCSGSGPLGANDTKLLAIGDHVTLSYINILRKT